MIGTKIPSLSILALAAALIHVLLLALVLPVMITLPATDDRAEGTVAVPVAVRTALPVPLASAAVSNAGTFSEVLIYGEGDADEVVLPAAVPIAAVGVKLPVRVPVTKRPPLVRVAALSAPLTAVPPSAAAVPVLAPEAQSVIGETRSVVARLPDFMPDAVPRPLLKPAPGVVNKGPPAVKKKAPPPRTKARRKPAPSSRPVTRARQQPAPKPKFGGFFSGRPGRSIFPFSASR